MQEATSSLMVLYLFQLNFVTVPVVRVDAIEHEGVEILLALASPPVVDAVATDLVVNSDQ